MSCLFYILYFSVNYRSVIYLLGTTMCLMCSGADKNLIIHNSLTISLCYTSNLLHVQLICLIKFQHNFTCSVIDIQPEDQKALKSKL